MRTKAALVTGGARGIARGIALDLAERGWSVAICYRTSKDEADETVRAMQALGAKAIAIQTDVSDPSASRELVANVESEFGGVDALVNGAGPYHRVPLLDETAEGWRSMFDNNLHPVFDLTQAVVPGMRERGFGRILSFAMANADRVQANPNVAAHFIAKMGILVLTRSLARVLTGAGITVNTISPGFVDTDSAPDSELQAVLPRIPAGRLGTVDDCVGAARFLLSDEAAYVSGANIVVSGGWGL
ncbi:MAG: SDR family oxidoreductase [Nannocystaceae bacterium]|nr:SDR family oxidoreductase [Nannocystaceae bacterium]